MFIIVDSRSGEQACSGVWSKAVADAKIQGFKTRQAAGGRPDISKADVDALTAVDLDKCGTTDGVTPLPQGKPDHWPDPHDCEGTGQPCPDQDDLVSESYWRYKASLARECEGWTKMAEQQL